MPHVPFRGGVCTAIRVFATQVPSNRANSRLAARLLLSLEMKMEWPWKRSLESALLALELPIFQERVGARIVMDRQESGSQSIGALDALRQCLP